MTTNNLMMYSSCLSQKIIKFIEEWLEHLALNDGQNTQQLSYVILATDLTFDAPLLAYSSFCNEIATCVDHGAHQY
jgi:hypothetical protein